MKQHHLFAAMALALSLTGCRQQPASSASQEAWIDHAEEVATYQLLSTAADLEDSLMMPRTRWSGYETAFLEKQLEHKINEDSIHANPPKELLGQRRLCSVYDWTSGFFPGSLWLAYELTGNDSLKAQAIRFTNKLNPVRKQTNTHDVGFMVNCSYGNALRLAPNDTIKEVLIETADNLYARFNPAIGCIRSWDFGAWNFPVIIDNMMNLELLFKASKLSGDRKYRDAAVRHAQTTLKNHFRPDYTCYHVVSYNNDGTVERKQTHQGKNDESAWSRGQGWAVYGYTLCYKETKDTAFLQQALEKMQSVLLQQIHNTQPTAENSEKNRLEQTQLLNQTVEKIVKAQTDVLVQAFQKASENTRVLATRQTNRLMDYLKKREKEGRHYSDVIETAQQQMTPQAPPATAPLPPKPPIIPPVSQDTTEGGSNA